MTPYTVQEFLTAPLDQMQRAADLENLADKFSDVPLESIVVDLRATLTQGIDWEQFRRLHILISHLYHQCGADIPLTTQLRTEVSAALTRYGTHPHTREEGTHVLLEP